MTPHITALYAGLCGFLLLYLSWRVVQFRRAFGVGIGDGGKKELKCAIRAHGNFVEYVPPALVLILLLELAGSSGWLIHGLGSVLIAGRILHAFGLSRSCGYSPGRFYGTLLTWSVMLAAAALNMASFAGFGI